MSRAPQGRNTTARHTDLARAQSTSGGPRLRITSDTEADVICHHGGNSERIAA